MIERIEIKKYILNGFQQQQQINYFQLKMQKLIELIKTNELDQAVIYAQKQVQINFMKPHLINEIEKVMSLLAYKDISKCPFSHLTQNSQRIKVASETYKEMKQAKITLLKKLLQWAQEILNSKLQYPYLIEISKGQFSKVQ
ncbi:unnamed protein product (macronuclear) [Paramecium tetraurelia]|uniref:CRA domain-containing protein n=1 Tax=Paramecium tetraurelia TaxID=5888 RepID=A0BCU4_PARTE|nr:uncharacterized protein GSPATT00004455001 [Paramecium tetraurelia]CAK56361.1 unnamed protein product [Paramecium tetraurelia]|eukprot:XP_001423759.1 hypothetical protein (macronuclear) [Paramecium tetraurelia strain d4-2]